MAVSGAADQFLPYGTDDRVDLLNSRLAELRRSIADEVLPELPGVLAARPGRHRRRQIDEVLLEAERLQPMAPRRLGRENNPMAAAEQHIADPDAVVGRPVDSRLRPRL